MSNRGHDSQPANAAITDVRVDGERVFVVKNESTTWDLYNNEARKVDDELVKDWTASLNFLLVFAAIFAAILTAFIIESKKMLEPDQTELLVDITLQYFNRAHNETNTPFSRPNYEPSSAAISINCLFFASLGTSLVAALASVVALQWVAGYDAAITRGGSSPKEQAQRRQFRFAGVERWRMKGLIASLPLLLYSSVVLFWAGAIQWMWTLHHVVGYIVAGGTAVAVLFYVSTTLLATAFASAPFRTPLSRGMYWLFGPLASTILRLFSWLPFKNAGSLVAEKFGAAWSALGGFMVSLHLGPESHSIKWIKANLMPGQTSLNREHIAAENDRNFEQAALTWLIQRLPRAAHSKKRLILLVSGIQQLAVTASISPQFNLTPWQDLFKFLNNHYLKRIFDFVASEEDYGDFETLLKSHWFISTKVLGGSGLLSYPYPNPPVGFNPALLPDTPTLPDLRDTFETLVQQHGEDHRPCHSSDEIQAAWQLIRSRNQAESDRIGVWGSTFKDMWVFSPKCRKWCLGYLERALLHYHSLLSADQRGLLAWRALHHPALGRLFTAIIDEGLNRAPNVEERLALARLFEVYLTGEDSVYPGLFIPESLIRTPLRYALSLEQSSRESLPVHCKITLLIARQADILARQADSDKLPAVDRQRWARWIEMMLWIGRPKKDGYWEALIKLLPNGTKTRPEELHGEVTRYMTEEGIPPVPHLNGITAILRELRNEDLHHQH